MKTEDGLEVDFLARSLLGEEELIQVCADVSDPGVLSRELRALTPVAKEHRRAKRRLLVLDRDALARVRARAGMRGSARLRMATGPAGRRYGEISWRGAWLFSAEAVATLG